MPYRYWTKEEIDYLRANYGIIRALDIARAIGRTDKAVEKKAAKLGLLSKVSGAPIRRDCYKNFGPYPTGEDHHAYRQPGIPWEQNGRMVIKRHPNSAPVAYARYLIEQMGGISLRSDEIVVHIDRNPLNCHPDNLMVISRAQHARRNSIHRYPSKIKRAIHALSKLKKAIQDAEEQAE